MSIRYIHQKEIKRLEQERAKLLQDHPELNRLQQQIEQKLDSIGPNPALRLHLTQAIMVNHINLSLLPALEALKTLVDEIKKETIERSPLLKLLKNNKN
ncbi:MAG: hypothetical protein ACO20H_03620 [Bacteriovoracaceae bacterium]